MNKEKIISLYQIVGALYGLYLEFYLLYYLGVTQINILFISPFIILYFVLGIAGILLYNGSMFGKKLSIMIQSLQVIQFSILSISFKFGAGIGLIIGFKDSLSKLLFNFVPIYAESSWGFNENGFYLFFNLIPLFVIVTLLRMLYFTQD